LFSLLPRLNSGVQLLKLQRGEKVADYLSQSKNLEQRVINITNKEHYT